jgi:cytoplasmic iron level regulating protein YaaA (DUF328/UPF0246 family)
VGRRLLIIAEGDVRGGAVGETPAVELFDGSLFSLVRDLTAAGTWPEDVDLYVVTSQFGMVAAGQPLKPYRRKMTDDLAAEAIYENFGRLAAALAKAQPVEMMLAMPEVYRRALIRKDTPQVQRVPVVYLDATARDLNTQLLSWLRRG